MKEKILAGIACLVVLLITTVENCLNFKNGTGEKIGQIVKVNKEGFLKKTWEAQLIRGGMKDGSGSFGTAPFDFTVPTDKMASMVKRYMEDGTEVFISYEIEGLYIPFRSGSGGCFLKEIRPLKK